MGERGTHPQVEILPSSYSGRQPSLFICLREKFTDRSIFHHALALSLSAGDALHAARYGSYFNSVSLALVQWGLNL